MGGEPEQLTTPDAERGEIDHLWPEVLPDGESVLFTIIGGTANESQIVALSVETGEQKVVLSGGAFPRYSSSGHLLYGVQGNLWAVGFDPNRLETIGDPVPVQQGVLTKTQGGADFGVSENGSLIYVPDVGVSADARTLVWVDRDGREEEILAPPAPYEAPRVSPDGRYVAVDVTNPDNSDVIVYDLQRNTPTRLTFDPSLDRHPLWSPDGQRVLFSSNREGPTNVYSKAADGTGSVERVTTSENPQWPQSWSADGQTLIVMDITSGAGGDLQGLALGADGQIEQLTQTPDFLEGYAEVSPDGRWIAYMSDESGQFEVYVQPFPNVEDGKWQISRAGGTSPVWGLDGQELFFRPFPNATAMMAVAVETEPTFNPGNPEILFPTPYRAAAFFRNRPWDVAPDGRFLMIKESAPGQATGMAPHVVVVENWFQALAELVP